MKYLRTVRKVSYPTQTKFYAEYLCDCGNKKVVRTDHVRSGRTTSCGCDAKQNAATHGLSNTRVYRIWCGLFRRYNESNPKARCYRDIKIDPSWKKFENFYKDMGKPPTDKHEIDRIDPYGDYEPKNCRWATRSEQMVNQKRNYMIFNQYQSLDPLVSYKMFRDRLRRGWDSGKAARQPKMKNQFG